MDPRRVRLLSELAQDATLERSDFVVRAADQLRRFLEANGERIDELGGMVLIDDEPDYLSIAPDLTFRSRTRYRDESGEWVSETEVIESVGELVELYNPGDILASFIESGREAEEGDEDEDEDGAADALPGAPDPYAGAADDWAASVVGVDGDDETSAASRLYDLALDYQTRSQQTEARLLSQFETVAANLANELGEFVVVDDEEQRLLMTAIGAFRAEVLAEEEDGSQAWRTLDAPDQLVEYYDPTDIFGDLADSLAEAYPAIAAGDAAAAAADGDSPEGDDDADAEDDDADDDGADDDAGDEAAGDEAAGDEPAAPDGDEDDR